MKTILALFAFLVCSLTVSAQKFGFVDTDYILKHIPEYATAQKQLNVLSDQWQKETGEKMQELDRLYKAYQKDQVLLSVEMKQKREEEIVQKEKAAKDFQKSHFGPDGELFKRRQALIKPIQDKVYKAISDIADDGQYAVIFDKSGEPTMLFASPRYDKSNDVITKLGLKPGVFAK